MREHDANKDDAETVTRRPPFAGVPHAGQTPVRTKAQQAPAPRLFVETGVTPRLLTPDQAAAYCGMSLTHWNTHVRKHLHTQAFGRRVLVDKKQLDEVLDQLFNPTPMSKPGEDALAARLRAELKSTEASKPKHRRQ